VRILHTSDWHLGRTLHREDLLGHQAGYVDHLLDVVESEQVDLVVVAGDIYDRALPPVDAVRLANETFTRLARSRAQVVITSGNHDSAQRLGFGSELIDAAGVFIRTRADSVSVPVLLEDAHGVVAVYGLPYLDPDAMQSAWSLRGRSHEAALGEAMSRVRQDQARRRARSVVLAHAFVAGARPSDSERDIGVGGISLVSSSVFAGVDYTALGHLHGQQCVSETIRYSGSPLAYSFSETRQVKGSWLVTLDATGLETAEFIAAPVPRRLAQIRGTLAELLSDPRLDSVEDCWVRATLTDDARPIRAMEQLGRRFPHTLVLGFEPTSVGSPTLARARSVTGRSDHEITLDFVNSMRGAPATPEESVLLSRATEACCDDRELDLSEVSG
jgi:DNA repair protein SbcD/Mre11